MKKVLRAIGALTLATCALAASPFVSAADKVILGVSIPTATHGFTGGIVWWANEAKKELEKAHPDLKIIVKTASGTIEQTVTNSIIIHNYRDVWGQVWDNTWNYRTTNMDIRGNSLLMLEQPFVPLLPGERPALVKCRMRSLGCSPCTGAVRSDADTVPKIIEELVATRHSERQLRVIDHDQDGSMELKKREGYF